MPVPLLIVSLLVAATAVPLGGCTSGATPKPEPQAEILWVRTAAEFEALCLQAYRAASEFLDHALADSSWSALPGQSDAHNLPPAIIFDVDETLMTNVDFQLMLEPPFRNSKLEDWNVANVAEAIPGAVEFVHLARSAGVEAFFVTNRPCEAKPGVDDPCPQQATTVQDLVEIGIPADADNVMLAHEQPGWDREKSTRREHIARTHRVIMLVGDDLGDFIPCTRHRPLEPCTQAATIASRREATNRHRDYWGAGWFILPNPMHGSWTTVE
jgi:acid phosphatase